MSLRIGIDVGGTFTDVVLVDDSSGRIHFAKTSTTPGDLAAGVLAGLDTILAIAGASLDEVAYLAHGTTIGTNALIEKTGARTGLIATDGFIDVLEIGRCQRPAEGMYDLSVDMPPPLVPRDLRRPVRERVNSEGVVLTPLDEASAAEAVAALGAAQVEAVAVSLLWSFRHPEHERRIGQILAERLPGVPVSLSVDVAPEFREFERTSTTVLNAYLQPVTARYLEALEARLAERWGRAPDVRIMQASGGSMTMAEARDRAVNMVNSGPAGGVIAAELVGRLTGIEQLIGIDMGGTSFDISLVVRGQRSVSAERSFAGYPVRIPVIDIDTIGAGGGSIAWLDAGGALNVGPRSAGARPGPACYARGGEVPTVTDANLVLGRLNPDYFLGGEMRLDAAAARRAIAQHVAGPMGLSVEDAAAGIVRIVNATMAKGIAVNSIERGHDVREFALVAFGGAGALHACDLADDLEVRRVVVPTLCGNLSALGLLVADARHDFVRTYARLASEVTRQELLAEFEALEQPARARLRADGFAEAEIETLWTVDARYEGQSYEINVPTGHDLDLERLLASFHDLHQRLYAYSSPEEVVQLVNLRLTAIGRVPPLRLAAEKRPSGSASGRRAVYFAGHGFLEAAIWDRAQVAELRGPAIVEEAIAATIVPPGWSGRADEYGNLILERD